MVTLEKIRNGHRLKIHIDTKELFNKFEDELNQFERDYASSGHTCMYEIGYNNEEYADYNTVKADYNRLKREITHWTSPERADQIWDCVEYKKNGTFKRTTKAVLAQQNYGPYYEDNYGWKVLELRVKADSDTEAFLELSDTIIHY